MTDFVDLNLKIPIILVISIFISSLNFMLSRVEHEKSFITSGPKTQFLQCAQWEAKDSED